MLTGSGGTITSRFSYDAYGNTLGQTLGASLLPSTAYLYSGEQFDSDLQQYYLRARYYDPSNGRFNRLDPFEGNNSDPQSLHKYAYAHSDPVNGIDPTGLATLVDLVVSMAIGGIISALISAYINRDKTGAEFWKRVGFDFAVGAITAPLGGLALKGASKAIAPLMKALFRPLMRAVGSMRAMTLVGATEIEKLVVKIARHLFNTNRTYPPVDKTLIGGFLKRMFPSMDWEMHHIWVKQAWTNAGGPSQIYSDLADATANEGLRRIGNGFWNLIPIPNVWHEFITAHPTGAPLFATVLYNLLIGVDRRDQLFEFMEDVFDDHGGEEPPPQL